MNRMSLDALEKAIERDLSMINCPPKPWRIEEDPNILDVAIIGAGMAGMAAAFALMKHGITHFRIFDAREKGKEGPWATYARMKTLRSKKDWMGPALYFPNITFQAWYEAQFGNDSWENLGKIPTLQWMDYLTWYRKVLQLPVQHNSQLLSIQPETNHLKLVFPKQTVFARKVILATGREGFGGMRIPSFIHSLPKSKWAHTSEFIDFEALKGKRIGIIGAGASAFDAAGSALEHHAKSVDMIMRRKELPSVNTERSLYYPGLFIGFFQLTDDEKWKFYSQAVFMGTPPPKEALDRVAKHPNFHLRVHEDAEKLMNEYDFLILGTGFLIDGSKQRELSSFFDDILLWKDKNFTKPHNLAFFPQLGSHFEFLEKKKGKAPFLKNIYCFNYAALLSHGALSGDIPGISIGAERVAAGIAADFFLEDRDKYYQKFKDCNQPDFQLEEYPFFQEQ